MATITATATADFEDVTQDFEAAARDMVTGEYLSDGQSFSLSSAMYATDSGDPQLDPAYGCTKVLIGGELLASDGEPLIALPDMRLAPHLVVGAMDRALRALAAWCDGKGSGLHTLYSCVYFQLPPEAITSAWLGPFVRGVVALHDYLIPYIKASSVVKSEDASALDCRQFNDRDLRLRALTPAEQRAQTLANASVEHANGAIRDLDAAIGALRPSEDREFYGTAEQTVEANVPADQRKTFASAIACRLSVVRHLLAVHTAIGECDMPRARKAARACLEEALPCVEGSLALGAEEPAGTFNAESWRRARGGIYVRRFAFPSAAEAVQTLRGMLEDVLEVCTVGGRDVTDYVALLHWAKHFTERPRSVLARVWASYLLRLTEKWLRRSAAVLTSGTFALIPVPKPIADHDSAVALEAAIAMAWEDTVDAFLLNRARLYRRLPAVFARWDGLQAEAAATDRALLALFPLDDDAAMAANPRKGMFFFMYVLHVKLFLMAEFLMCGLGLGLYCEHEYRYTLWYADYLLGIAENCLHDSIAQLEVFNRIHGGNGTSNNNSNGKKKTKRTKADKKNELMRELYSYYIGTYLLNIRGLVRVNNNNNEQTLNYQANIHFINYFYCCCCFCR